MSDTVGRFSLKRATIVEGLTHLDIEYDARNVVRIDINAALAMDDFPAADWAAQVRARLRAGVDAWVCASATTGQTLQRFFAAEGVRIPEDAALVSYHGGSNPIAPNLPQITTTDVVDEELGAAAVRRLIDRLDMPGESRRSILVPARLVVGATTRPVLSGTDAPDPLAALV